MGICDFDIQIDIQKKKDRMLPFDMQGRTKMSLPIRVPCVRVIRSLNELDVIEV